MNHCCNGNKDAPTYILRTKRRDYISWIRWNDQILSEQEQQLPLFYNISISNLNIFRNFYPLDL